MEDRARADIRRGQEAQALLNNELLKDTIEYLRRAYMDAWSACKTTELREANWYLLKGLERFEEHLHHVLDDGMLAHRHIEEMVKRQGRRAA